MSAVICCDLTLELRKKLFHASQIELFSLVLSMGIGTSAWNVAYSCNKVNNNLCLMPIIF